MRKVYYRLISFIFISSTLIQSFLSVILGVVLGFIPDISYAPFLFILVIFLVLIFRVNIKLFLLTLIFAKVLSYLLGNVSFTIGVFLLESKITQPIFKTIVNTPILAYTGFDYYIVAGSFVIALILGIIFCLFICKIYKKLIKESKSTIRLNQCYKHQSMVNWRLTSNKKKKHLIRLWGVGIVVMSILFIIFSPTILQTTIVGNIIKQQLTRVNGATVNYNSIKLNLSDAKLEILGLEITDPNNLNNDRFYVKRVSVSIDISELLIRHLSLNNVIIKGIKLDKKREERGMLYANLNRPKTKDLYLNLQEDNKNFENIDITSSIKEWIKLLSNFKFDKKNNIYSYKGIRDENLREAYPSLVIKNIDIIDYEDENTIYDVKINNLSSNPILIGKPTKVDIKSINNKDINIKIFISNQKNVSNTIDFNLHNVKRNYIKGLTIRNVGIDIDSIDLSGKGMWEIKNISNVSFNIPLTIKINNVGFNFAKIKQHLSNLTLNSIISGDLNNLSFSINILPIKKDC